MVTKNPNDVSVWTSEGANPLSLRWHGPALLIALGMVGATAALAIENGFSLRDTDNMLSGRMWLLCGGFGFSPGVAVLPRPVRRPQAFPAAVRVVFRERWNRR